ncbi:unnamed protein product, partial [Closterium sp. NIES-54]
DHFLALEPTALTVDLLEQHLLAAKTSVVEVGAARGTPRTPFIEGCSPSPLAPSYASAAAADVPGVLDVGAASASAKRRSSKGKGGRGGGGGSGGGGGGSSGGGGGSGGGGSGESGGGRGALVAVVEATVGVAVVPVVGVVAAGLELRVEFLEEARGSSSSVGARPRPPSSFTCGKLHTQHRCFSLLDVAWRAKFGDEAERPRWAELLRSGVAILDLDFDAIPAAMYALSVSAEGDCYLCVPPDPGIEAAALGASESVLPGTVPVEALHTFTLDSGSSCCFFRDRTTLTPLSAPVPVRLADPPGGLVLACSSTVLPCPAVPSDSLSGLHLPSLSTNLVSTAALQDAMVTTTAPGGQRVLIYTCTRTGHHLATFTRRLGSSLYTLATEPPQVVVSAQTLLWHHRLGQPSLPRLRGMHSHLLVYGLPRSLPPLPPSPALPCLPCIEGRQRAAPHSSSFPPTTAPLQTLHMDVWGPACVSGQGRERYFLLVVDDFTRYTTVFPLRSKGQVVNVSIPWIRTLRLQICERFRTDLPVLRVHSDRGGEFSSDLLRDFCRGEGILQSFTLPDSPQQNGIAERRIGLVMEVARTSMIHAAAPHFLWPFAVWGPRAFVRDTCADKLSACAIPYVFLGFSPDAPGWQFYHPTSRRVFPSQDVTFDESIPFYRLFPYRSAPPPPLPLFLAHGPPPVDPLPSTAPVEVVVGSGAARGATSWGAASGGAEPGGAVHGGAGSTGAGSRGAEPEGAESEGAGSGGAELGGVEPADVEPGGAEPEGVEPGGTVSEGAESGGAELRGTASSRGVTAGAGGTEGAAAAGPRGARTRGTRAAGTTGVGGAGIGDPTEPGAVGAGAGGTSAGGAGAGGDGAIDPGDGGAGGTVQPRLYFVPLLQQVLGVPSSTGLPPPLLCPPPDQSEPLLQPASPLHAPLYTEQTGGLTERREPASCPSSPVRTGRRIPRPRPPPVPGTHAMALRPSSVPLRVPLPPPPESSLPAIPNPESDRTRAASPSISRLLATVVTDPSFESIAASALVAELVDFATACLHLLVL